VRRARDAPGPAWLLRAGASRRCCWGPSAAGWRRADRRAPPLLPTLEPPLLRGRLRCQAPRGDAARRSPSPGHATRLEGAADRPRGARGPPFAAVRDPRGSSRVGAPPPARSPPAQRGAVRRAGGARRAGRPWRENADRADVRALVT